MTVENTTAPVVETTDAPNDLVADPEVVETEGPDAEATEAPGEIEIDITEDLSDDQIRDLFAAFNDEDWSEVDRLIDEFEATGVWGGTETEGKAGGADRNRGNAEVLRRYWTVGKGAAKIRWNTPGDWTRCVEHLSKYMGPRAKGWCALRHKERNGFYPGSRLNKGDDGDMQTKDTGEQTPAMMEFKTFDLKGLDVVDAEQGIVEAIVSVTGVVDNVNDLILPGAYAKTLAARTPKGVYCVDADTEALTSQGWKRYTDISAGDLVYTLGSDGQACFQPVEAMNVFPKSTYRMREITTTSHCSLTTADHRWLVQRRDGALHWRTTETLLPEDKIVRAAPSSDTPDEPKYSDAFVRVVAWFWTEGYKDDKRLVISQSARANPHHCRMIEAALDRVSEHWNVQVKENGQAQYRLDQSASAAVLSVTGQDKAPTADFLMSLTQAQMEMFINVCIDGDGHRHPDGAAFFNQTSKHSVSMFEMACAIAGIPTRTVLRSAERNMYSDRPCHRVTLASRATAMPLKAVAERIRLGHGNRSMSTDRWVDYDGVVWCPTTVAGTWLARRGGTVWFTGNSHSWETPVSRTLAVKELMPGDPELPKTMPNGDPWPAEAGALKVKTQFNLSTQRGREAYSDVVFFGDDSAWSIGYQVPVGGAKIDQKSGVRRIADIDLYEYSPVLFGAMPLAHTTSVKKAQLAMKALQAADSTPWHHTEPQTEPPTARVVDQPRLPQTKDMVMETPEDQMVLVKQAIDVLTDLLAVVNADIDTKADMPEQEAPEAEEAVDYDTLTKALEAMVDDDGLRQTLTKVAEPVDAAIAADDADALDTSIGTFLDEVEAAMGDEENADLLKTIAAMVADLIEYLAGDDDDEAPEPAEEPPTEDTVDIKRDYGPEAREKMAEDDEALDDGSFPIKNRTDLGNAIKAVGRAKDPDKARAHIKKRAKELDAEDMLPDSWNEEKVVLSADEIKAFVQQFNEK